MATVYITDTYFRIMNMLQLPWHRRANIQQRDAIYLQFVHKPALGYKLGRLPARPPAAVESDDETSRSGLRGVTVAKVTLPVYPTAAAFKIKVST